MNIEWRNADEVPVATGGVHYWAYFPEIGNNDDGWGYVGICCHDGIRWVNWLGRPQNPQPIAYARITKPEPPCLGGTQDDAARMAAGWKKRALLDNASLSVKCCDVQRPAT